MPNLPQMVKMHLTKSPKCLSSANKFQLSDVLNLQKVTFFHFYPTDLVDTKQLSSSGSVSSDLPRRFASRYIAPLSTPPSGDSCILLDTLYIQYTPIPNSVNHQFLVTKAKF